MIIQSQRCRQINGIATRDIAFTTAQADALRAQAALAELLSQMGCAELEVNSQVAKVSVVGAGMVQVAGVAARMFQALADRQINIQMIATSEIKISCLVADDQAVAALRAVHAAFDLAGDRAIEVPA